MRHHTFHILSAVLLMVVVSQCFVIGAYRSAAGENAEMVAWWQHKYDSCYRDNFDLHVQLYNTKDSLLMLRMLHARYVRMHVAGNR